MTFSKQTHASWEKDTATRVSLSPPVALLAPTIHMVWNRSRTMSARLCGRAAVHSYTTVGGSVYVRHNVVMTAW